MQWQPIETAPKDGSPVWVKGYNFGDAENGEHRCWAWWNGNYWCDAVACDPTMMTHLTHWLQPDTQRTDPPNCEWHRDEFGNWFSGCSETMPDFTPWKGTDPKGSFCPKCGKNITVRVHDKP